MICLSYKSRSWREFQLIMILLLHYLQLCFAIISALQIEKMGSPTSEPFSHSLVCCSLYSDPGQDTRLCCWPQEASWHVMVSCSLMPWREMYNSPLSAPEAPTSHVPTLRGLSLFHPLSQLILPPPLQRIQPLLCQLCFELRKEKKRWEKLKQIA